MSVLEFSYVLLLVSCVRAFQYTELMQHVDSHREEYVQVRLIISSVSLTNVSSMFIVSDAIEFMKRV